MELIFWQGIISIHQQSFLEEVAKLPDIKSVTLVVAQTISDYRKNMGWDVPEVAGVDLIVAPDNTKIDELIANRPDAVHIMGGIKVGEMLNYAFDKCVSNHRRIGIMTEPYNADGIKGKLRSLKYKYQIGRYGKHIDFVLAIGNEGMSQYKQLGYDISKLFAWAYFINVTKYKTEDNATDEVIRYFYSGRLEGAKGILKFLNALLSNANQNYRFTICGSGPDEQLMKEAIDKAGANDRITIQSFMPHKELLKLYKDADWVVLPSAGKDGWGVIVSEGLLNGCKAICSVRCGASAVVRDGWNGVTFSWETPDEVNKAIEQSMNTSTFAGYKELSEWASKTLSAAAGAKYLSTILSHIYANGAVPITPWKEQ